MKHKYTLSFTNQKEVKFPRFKRRHNSISSAQVEYKKVLQSPKIPFGNVHDPIIKDSDGNFVTWSTLLCTPAVEVVDLMVYGSHRAIRSYGCSLIGELMDKVDSDLSPETMTVGKVLDYHCDFNWTLA
jgi:hypothetical protein